MIPQRFMDRTKKVIWTQLKGKQISRETKKQFMMTTQAVNDSPKIYGQEYKVIWTQLKCIQILRETQKPFMMKTQAVYWFDITRFRGGSILFRRNIKKFIIFFYILNNKYVAFILSIISNYSKTTPNNPSYSSMCYLHASRANPRLPGRIII